MKAIYRITRPLIIAFICAPLSVALLATAFTYFNPEVTCSSCNNSDTWFQDALDETYGCDQHPRVGALQGLENLYLTLTYPCRKPM